MVSSFERTIVPPFPLLNYKNNINTKMGIQTKLPEIKFQHHSQITYVRKLYKSLSKSRSRNPVNH